MKYGLPYKLSRNSVLYGIVTLTRTGEQLCRVRLDAPDATARMRELVEKHEGKVTINVVEAEAADGSGSLDARRPPSRAIARRAA